MFIQYLKRGRSRDNLGRGFPSYTTSFGGDTFYFFLTQTHSIYFSVTAGGDYLPLQEKDFYSLFITSILVITKTVVKTSFRWVFWFYSMKKKITGSFQFFTQLDYMRDNDKFRRICNSTKPEPFYSPGSTVMIHFHSNYKDTYPGFQMSYSTVEGNKLFILFFYTAYFLILFPFSPQVSNQ